MFATFHLVHGLEERRSIVFSLNPDSSFDGEAVELMGIAQGEETPFAYGITKSLSAHSSELSSFFFDKQVGTDTLVLRLLDYLGWELTQQGKNFLIIREIADIRPLAALLEKIRIPPKGSLICKLDGTPLSTILGSDL